MPSGVPLLRESADPSRRNGGFLFCRNGNTLVRAHDPSGGQAHLCRIDKYGRDGHRLFFGDNGYGLQGPLVANYLASIKPASGKQ
ncbi:hypothetical protein GCM10010872_39870 [Dyella flava]|nr:hypothetical protein GCM10010872_39870 [Dyella flava]